MSPSICDVAATNRKKARLPVWVKNDPDALEMGCLFYPRITDLSQTSRHVRKAPSSGVGAPTFSLALSACLAGTAEGGSSCGRQESYRSSSCAPLLLLLHNARQSLT